VDICTQICGFSPPEKIIYNNVWQDFVVRCNLHHTQIRCTSIPVNSYS